MKPFIFSLFLFPSLVFGSSQNLVTLDEITRITPEMEAYLAENISSDLPYNEKLVTLVKLVFNKEFINLTYDNHRTKTAAETFQTRSGNCLSFTNMFIVMARHIGLKAHFQEVRNLPTWDRNGRVVVLNRHINALVYIREKKVTVDFNPYEEHTQIWTHTVTDERALAQFYNNFGAEAFAHGDNELAISNFLRAIEIAPKMSFSRTNLGVVYSSMDQFDLAEKTYLEAIELSKNDLTAINNLATLYTKTGQFDKAKSYQRKVNFFRKKNPYYHYNLGMDAFRREEYSDAVTHFKRAIRRKAEDHQFYFAIAKAYAFLGNMNKATDSLKKAQNYAPDVFDRNRYSQKLNMLAIR